MFKECHCLLVLDITCCWICTNVFVFVCGVLSTTFNRLWWVFLCIKRCRLQSFVTFTVTVSCRTLFSSHSPVFASSFSIQYPYFFLLLLWCHMQKYNRQLSLYVSWQCLILRSTDQLFILSDIVTVCVGMPCQAVCLLLAYSLDVHFFHVFCYRPR